METLKKEYIENKIKGERLFQESMYRFQEERFLREILGYGRVGWGEKRWKEKDRGCFEKNYEQKN